ncbi:MAG: metal-dependent transcriptional regulator [Clostridia bacterium]|jgi:Mn-dependent DtxR family transcriptional regulator|nr:metal-dependent transcriptional regulator [Clostridia bacterium]NLV33384.1 metal-dependent transcriptional regulator [Clostridiaceae bacterium]MDD4501704.1 metal-dependent transcriptional regulator [Clostridia bacterium]HPB17232.1 metal-dependent transcriptional regulator [Clostridia bacterium]HQM95470.1 metal-dependent transcriptional regulator [Clostridia bacterium]
MNIQESAEMYLETILILLQTSDMIRSIDIVNYTGYTKPSISRAVNLLKKNGYLNIDEKGYISLTASGEEIAINIYERHCVLTDVLLKLGIDEKTAKQDACKIEHVISNDTFNKIKEALYK